MEWRLNEKSHMSHFWNSKNNFKIMNILNSKLTVWSPWISSSSWFSTCGRARSTRNGRGRNHIISGRVVDRIPPEQGLGARFDNEREFIALSHFAAANYAATQPQSSQESYENDMLYGFKRKEGAKNGIHFADVVQQISEKSTSENRKRSTAYAKGCWISSYIFQWKMRSKKFNSWISSSINGA